MATRNPNAAATGAVADQGVTPGLVTQMINAALGPAILGVQQQIAGLPVPTLGTIGGQLDPAKVKPVTVGLTTYADLPTALTAIDVKASAGGTPNPTAPVKNAAPTVTFPGGTGDVGETPTYHAGTYLSGTVTSRDLRILMDGVVVQTVVGIVDLATLPAIPAGTGGGTHQYSVIEDANWAGQPPTPNPSQSYTINAAGVPVNVTPPVIAPASATELDTLTADQDVWSIGGVNVANSTLTRTRRWSFDWTLTGALSGGATSATLNAVWNGATGPYPFKFSNGDVRTVTLTNLQQTATWAGGLSGAASSAVKIQVATLDALPLNPNNIAHTGRCFMVATGTGGASAEVEASNTVTPTSSAGSVEPGHYYLSTIPALGAKSWADYQSRRTAYWALAYPTGTPPVPNMDAEALVASIPTSGGTTLAAGASSAQIATALASFTIVFLAQGTYNLTSMPAVPANKWLIGLGTGAILNCATINTFPHYGMHLFDSAKLVNVSIVRPASLGVWFDGNFQFLYKVSLQEPGYGVSTANPIDGKTVPSAIGYLGGGAHSVVMVSCEGFKINGGSDGDGCDCGQGGGNWTFVDNHFRECDDDGLDTWDAVYPCFMHYVDIRGSGNNTSPYASRGDGNAFKLGRGGVRHFLNQCNGQDCWDYAYNYNLSSVRMLLRLCTSSNNTQGTYAFSGAVPDPTIYEIVNV